ncbi:hypothetical protein GCM10025783_12030 [Amnibacterium soli]|uniref:HD domain-containing protein n=1 Tax=Amnibacterium soli TaxID=1282736 RepID=A0ABP8YXB5_9MICO
MTTYRMGDADVRLFISATDSDLPMDLGAYAEVASDLGVEMVRHVGGGWVREPGTAADLLEKDSRLTFETHRHAFDDVDAEAVPRLQHQLEQVALARRIATEAHRGQTDKLGVDYIEHPRRVAARLDPLDEQAVAWLHDVLEDTEVTAEDLRAQGVDGEVVDAVQLLTRSEDEATYYAFIAGSPLARSVKLADIADNTDPERTARLDTTTRQRLAAKYRHARRALGAEEEQA